MKIHLDEYKNSAAVIVFPDIYMYAVHSLVARLPFLRMSCMEKILIQKALYFTLHAVLFTNDSYWDTKIENGIDPNTLISFREIPPDIFDSHIFFEKERRENNEHIVDKLIAYYVRSLEQHKILRLNKPNK